MVWMSQAIGRISNPRFELQLGHQPFKPAEVSAGLDAHPHLLTRQSAVEPINTVK
jgi:hypothetical protein